MTSTSCLQVPTRTIGTSETDDTEDSVSTIHSHSDVDVNPSDHAVSSPEQEPLSPIKPPPIPTSPDEPSYPTRRRASTSSSYRSNKRRKRRDPSRQADDYGGPPSFHISDFDELSDGDVDVRVDTDTEDLSDL